jgi:hypothetical protein
MKKTRKKFDCVEMKHAAGLRIHEEIKNMTREEQLAYWQRKNEEARHKYPQMRVSESSAAR